MKDLLIRLALVLSFPLFVLSTIALFKLGKFLHFFKAMGGL
jgi:hypothetical protein